MSSAAKVALLVDMRVTVHVVWWRAVHQILPRRAAVEMKTLNRISALNARIEESVMSHVRGAATTTLALFSAPLLVSDRCATGVVVSGWTAVVIDVWECAESSALHFALPVTVVKGERSERKRKWI